LKVQSGKNPEPETRNLEQKRKMLQNEI
jgi:hypothetical protein